MTQSSRVELDGIEQTQKQENGTQTRQESKAKSRFRVSRASRLLVMLTMTFLFFIIELVFGYMSHSMALVADSFHMMSDVMALAIAYGCLKIAERSTKKNTFGWVRAEVLGALVNGVFLLALCFSIFVESIQRLVEPEKIKDPRSVLIVGAIGFVINLIGMGLFHGHAHSSHAVEDVQEKAIEAAEGAHLLNSHQDMAIAMAELEAVEESLMTSTPKRKKAKNPRSGDHLNMRAVFLHVVSDAIGSVIVIATALVSWLVPGYDGLKLYMDPSLSIIMVILMVCTTLPLVRETALILLQTTPKFVDIEKLKFELLLIDGIVAIHDFHVWRLVGERIIATVHIRFQSLRHYISAAEQIRSLFHDNHIHSSTIQPEFAEMDTTTARGISECTFACLPNNCALIGDGNTVTCCDKTVTGKRSSPPAQAPKTTIHFEDTDANTDRSSEESTQPTISKRGP